MWAVIQRERFLVAVTFIAISPVLVAFLRALAHGWWPESDDAMLGLKVADVWSSNPPTMGMRTTAGNVDPDLSSHHPGPLGIYLLALPAGLLNFHPVGLSLGTALIHIGLTLLVCHIAYRRGGTRLALLALASVAIIQWAAGPEPLFRPLNPFPAAIGVLALLFLTWSLLVGDTRYAWVFVFVVSLVAQANLAFLPLAAVLCLVVIIASLRRWIRQGAYRPIWLGRGLTSSSGRQARRAFFAITACWLPVLVETVTTRPSNVLQTVRYVLADTGDHAVGWPSALRTLPPRLIPVPGGFSSGEQLFEQASFVLAVAGWAIVAIVVVLATPLPTRWWPEWGTAERRAAAVSIIALAVVVWSWASAPASLTGVPWYWLIPVWGCVTFVWIILAEALWRAAPTRSLLATVPSRMRFAPRRAQLVGALVVALLAAMAVMSPAPMVWRDEAGREASALVLAQLDEIGHERGAVRITSGGGWTAWINVLPAISYRLRFEGFQVYSVGEWPFPEDVDFRSATHAPIDAIEIHLLERATAAEWVGATDGHGWRRIGLTQARPDLGQAEVAIYLRLPAQAR